MSQNRLAGEVGYGKSSGIGILLFTILEEVFTPLFRECLKIHAGPSARTSPLGWSISPTDF